MLDEHQQVREDLKQVAEPVTSERTTEGSAIQHRIA
jgi:hypothetical protein